MLAGSFYVSGSTVASSRCRKALLLQTAIVSYVRWRGVVARVKVLCMTKRKRQARDNWKCFTELKTRWIDNDIYGHVNNVIYYSYFDTAVANWLIESELFDPVSSPSIFLVVESSCTYYEPISHPEILEIGLRAIHVGRSSVHYSIGVFKKGSSLPVVQGHFVHVAVDRIRRSAVPLTDALRDALLKT